MKEEICKFIGIIFFSIFIIVLNEVSFVALFIVSTIWIIYIHTIIREISKKKKKKWLNILAKTYQSLVIMFIASFLIIEGILVFNMIQFKEAKDIETLEYLIVLGAGLDGEKVGKTLKSRLDEAIKYYELNKNVNIIVSGGQGEDEVISEAEAMERYLVKNNINPNRIIKEEKATTTLENIKFSKEI